MKYVRIILVFAFVFLFFASAPASAETIDAGPAPAIPETPPTTPGQGTVEPILAEARVVKIDRCGWKRDRVRIPDNAGFTEVTIRQLTKTLWRVRIKSAYGYVLTPLGATSQWFYVRLTNKSC